MINLMKDTPYEEEIKRNLIELIRGATGKEIEKMARLISGKNKYEIISCRVCGSSDLMNIISFGNQHVIDFVDSAEKQSEKVPLDLVLCNKCKLLQLKHNAPKESMWGGQYWYKSAINKLIRENLKEIVNEAEKVINLKRDDVVVDIGCNDGTMLGYYTKEGVQLIGFEPSINVANEAIQKGFKVFNNYFNAKDFKKEFGQKKAKVITAISMFYDLEDPNAFLRDVVECLDPNGVFVVQQNYVVKMLENTNFDNVCHEHREYYSMFSFKNLLDRHNLEIFDLSLNEINGGSIRALIKFKGNNEINGFKGSKERIVEIERVEKLAKIDTLEPYLAFAKRAESLKKQIMDFIESEIRKGKIFGVCGASTRGNTILQYFGLDNTNVVAAADANPDKWGKKTVGGLIPIVSVEDMQKINPDYQIVMIWHLFEGLVEKEKEYLNRGGKFILPIPEFRIIEVAKPVKMTSEIKTIEGNGREIKKCRMCYSDHLYEFLDLGFAPPSDAILSKEDLSESETFFPLKVLQCKNCGLTQLSYAVNPKILYGYKYKYESSMTKTGRSHFFKMADSICQKFNLEKNSLVIDIGSNVGVLLEQFQNNGMRVLGIDPAPEICKKANERGIETWENFLGYEVASRILSEKGKAKIITATNVFAHIDDKETFMNVLKNILDEKGVFIFEAPYLVDLIEKIEYDTIYLEHLEYLSVKPLIRFFEKHGMDLFDVERYEIHGSSIRVFVCKKGERPISKNVEEFMNLEEERGIYKKEVLENFANEVKVNRSILINLLRDLKKEGKKIIGISAPAKGNTILNYCKIGGELMDYITEKSIIKRGHYTPGMHIPIVGEEESLNDKPDYGLILAWNFGKEIMENNENFRKNGGKFIIPVPKPRIIE